MPRYRASQGEVAEWAKKAARGQSAAGDEEGREARRAQSAIERIYRGSAIERRSSVLPDFAREPDEFVFFPKNWGLDPAPTTAERMQIYEREAPLLAAEACERAFALAPHVPASAVTHLVVVTCTGFFAPGLDALLVKRLGLRSDVARTQIGFMGCYAAFPALRQADAFCRADPEAVVLVVCVELCSLHFQRELTMENVVANCLFSDGSAAALLSSEPEGSTRGVAAIVDSYTTIEDDSEEQMTWTVTDNGFRMTLSSEVPDTLDRSIAPFVATLLGRNGLTERDVGFWAVHPGGRRIVEAVRERLELTERAVSPSFEVLAENGNMSSPTVLFVLDRCLQRRRAAGTPGVAMAFGPGLTLESMLFETV